MSGDDVIIIKGGLLRPWHVPPYPGYENVRDRFSIPEIDRINSFQTKTDFTFWDKLFLANMYRKLIFSLDV